MNNAAIASVFASIADILEIQNENPFRVRSYRRAAMTVESLPHPLDGMDEAQVKEIPGIGESMASKIHELVSTGRLKFYESLKSKIPPGLLEMSAIPGLGPKTVKKIWDELGIKTLDQLEKAARGKKLREIKGLGEKLEEKIIKGAAFQRRYKERRPLGKMMPLADELLELLRRKAPVDKIEIAGSLRRMRDTIADIDLVASSRKPDRVMEVFTRLPQVAEVLGQGETKASVLVLDGVQCDLRVVEEKSFGAALYYFTGSKAHNIRVRHLALEKGLKINEYGIFKVEKFAGGRTEEEIFEAVGLPFIAPEIREDRGEIEAALAGKLPRLIELKDVLGDCHMHTDWSDGRLPLPKMAEAACRRYRYAAVTDHSHLLGITKGMDAAALLRQVAEIHRLAQQQKNCALLCGIEVDILADGKLDMPDETLAKLDLAVASVHTRFNMSEEEMTRRIMKAMENPHTTVIGHPTGRLIGRREPYAVNMEKLIDKARETDTFLELNSHWDRLDLNDVHLRMAREKGVKIMIDTDAHDAAHFEMMKYGVATARRGWLEPKDVVNTLPAAKFLKAVRAKRTRP